MENELHIAALVKQKQAAIHKGTRQGLIASAVVIAGGVIRHQWGIPGEILVALGLLASGWIAHSIWDARQMNTKFYG